MYHCKRSGFASRSDQSSEVAYQDSRYPICRTDRPRAVFAIGKPERGIVVARGIVQVQVKIVTRIFSRRVYSEISCSYQLRAPEISKRAARKLRRAIVGEQQAGNKRVI